MTQDQDITRMLDQATAGDARAVAKVLEIVYEQLRVMARGQIAHEHRGGGRGGAQGEHTLNPTALVHEVYLRLVRSSNPSFESRRHFFGAAARAMRQVLVDAARERKRLKRGGGVRPLSIDDSRMGVTCTDTDPSSDFRSWDWLDLERAVVALNDHDSELAEIVQLRFYAGLTVEAAAEVLGVSARTVQRDWRIAQAWLHRWLTTNTGINADSPK